MTPINELSDLLAKATPGPWEKHRHGSLRGSNGKDVNVRMLGIGLICGGDPAPVEEANAALIVAAVNSLPALLQRIKELEGENALLVQQVHMAVEGAQPLWSGEVDALKARCAKLMAAVGDIRVFAQDLLDNGHLFGGQVGDVMGIRDVCDRAAHSEALKTGEKT